MVYELIENKYRRNKCRGGRGNERKGERTERG